MSNEIKQMDRRKQEICEIIFEFIGAGFKVELEANGFVIKETFKSTSRDKWETKTVADTWGTFKYFVEEGNVLNLTLDSFREYKQELLENKDLPLTRETSS